MKDNTTSCFQLVYKKTYMQVLLIRCDTGFVLYSFKNFFYKTLDEARLKMPTIFKRTFSEHAKAEEKRRTFDLDTACTKSWK